MDLDKFKILYNRFSKLPLDKEEFETEEYDDYVTALNDSKECSDWYLRKELDKRGFDYSGFCCLKIAKHISDGIAENEEIIYDNVDIILRKQDNGTIGIPIHDGGTSMVEINYCPFCGKKLNYQDRLQMKTETNNITQLLDRVFDKLGQKPLFKNSEFKPENDLNSDFFLRYYSVDKPDRIKMMFEISEGGLSFWIDRASEIPEWSNDYIQQYPEKVEQEVINLFSKSIRVDRQGNKTTIIILAKDNREIRNYRFYQGFGLHWLFKKHTKIYKPYFEN